MKSNSAAVAEGRINADVARVWYRFRISLWRYLRPRDLLLASMLILALLLFLVASQASQLVATLIFSLYVFFFVTSAVQVWDSRQERDHVQAGVLRSLFLQMHHHVFNDDPRVRFTYFIRSPLNPGVIVPWYRYSPGTTDVIVAALQSRAQYKRGEGITAEAWKSPGELLLARFPRFESRKAFENYYIDELGISRDVAYQLSAYMKDVQAIFAYGFVDRLGRLLGVLSLDIQAPVVGAEARDQPIRIGDFDFDADAMYLILSLVGGVLGSFSESQLVISDHGTN